MNQILPIRARRPKGRHALRLGVALCLAAAPVSAGTEENTPDGIPAGPIFFAPWLETEVLADDNVFSSTIGVSDVITTVSGGVTAYIPIRMSDIQIGYQGSTYSYRDAVFEGTDTHQGSALFNLNFSNHYTLILEGTYTSGTTERQGFDDSGELVRQGIPFNRNRFAVEWVREVAHEPSWSARIEHLDHRYDSDQDLPWLDYEGWTIDYNYAQPIYRRGALTGRYNARRQDQFEAGPGSALLPAVPDNVPLRREVYDAVEVGYSGVIGRRQPFFASVGYARFGYRDVQHSNTFTGPQQPTDFNGIVGSIRWRLPLGTNNMDVSVSRVPLTSSLNTYYLVNDVRLSFDRRFLEISRYGISILASRNAYGESVDVTANEQDFTSCGVGVVRHDQRHQVRGFWEWFIQPRLALRLTADHNRRNSNCKTSAFRSNGVGLTFRAGWF